MKPRSIQQLLQSFSLFQNLSEMELELLASIAIHRSYPEGTHIFMQGETLKTYTLSIADKLKYIEQTCKEKSK